MIITATAPDRRAVVINLDTSQITAALGFAVGVGSAAALFWTRVGKPIKQFRERAELFWSDWQGTPDRPGVPGRLGMMERVANVEHELQTNGGGSLRDAVKSTQTAVEDIKAQMDGAHVIALPGHVQPAAGTNPREAST